MKNLFLGLGKVNMSLAAVVSGEATALVETDSEVVVYRWDSSASKFNEESRHAGNFDQLEWKDFLPARVFVSPGIDPRRPFFQEVKEHEVRELSFFSSRFQGKIICITGTDGKSTFTFQLGEILKRALPSQKIFVGGNLGTAMCEALKADYDIAVLEVSSFQTERLSSGRFDAGIILNLATDHLDRYNSLDDYFDAKWNLLRFSKYVAYPTDVTSKADKKSSIAFSNDEVLEGIEEKFVQFLSKEWNFSFSKTLFEDLPTLPHRLEIYKTEDGRIFVDDSKATTVHAALFGLRKLQISCPQISLILGGKFKGDNFTKIVPQLRKADQILIYGEARHEIESQLKGASKRFKSYPHLSDLLNVELPQVPQNSCLLLSPGCSSYDEFENFEERGKFFINAVEKHYVISKSRR